MRLTCPNCDAQYEVPDEVIPRDGRDVQCSNCGDTWFQNHAASPGATAEPAPPRPDPAPPRPDNGPETTEPPLSKPDTQEISAQQARAPQQAPQPQAMDAGISDILREEAEREADLRASEATEPLESQPDLGLDNMPDNVASQRAQEASDRMARIRGEPTPRPATTGSRRELLPDIEEINSSLRASTDEAASHTAVGPIRAETPRKNRSGFVRGFMLVLLIAVVLVVVYANAPEIAKAVPQTESVLGSYVAAVDQARVWLDAQLGELVAKPTEPPPETPAATITE